MKMKLFTVAMGLAFTATAFTASAQKAYKQGLAIVSMNVMGQAIDAKSYFTVDSAALEFATGPASIKVITDSKSTFMAFLVDIPVASRKIAAVATPAEIEEETGKFPKLTFAPTTETKVINGFNCKKVVATNPQDNKTYDIWVTNDISLPLGANSKFYEKAGGVPVQYYSFQNGQAAQVTLKSVTEQAVPKGYFRIPADFDRITMEEFNAMRGGGGN
ncbi:hypothetical protein [Mucilaginibacter pedocola]|uniref:DUF4412 domain-containing protein n=1 Tax=Mucilaginibacter pedocola TaxID=1792845 RepID=A0A1S9PH79_9SPHI|nr:hypothetical protein [Mucilaginibacter pedocola]OOQ59908.1 hypothetical protein BC343_27505 [Mucilaginibacter pedocola]